MPQSVSENGATCKSFAWEVDETSSESDGRAPCKRTRAHLVPILYGATLTFAPLFCLLAMMKFMYIRMIETVLFLLTAVSD